MQTIYTTSNRLGIRDNVVDLNAYRRRVQRQEEQQAAGTAEVDPLLWAREERPVRRRSVSRAAGISAWLLDICASAGVLAMTAAFTVQML